MSNGAVLAGKAFSLPDGGHVTVPIYDYVRDGDRRIEGVGVDPTTSCVMPTLADARAAAIRPSSARSRNCANEVWPRFLGNGA